MLFSIATVQFYIPVNIIQEFQFTHILTNMFSLDFLIIAILTCTRFVILICLSLILTEAEPSVHILVNHLCIFGEVPI